MDLGPWTITGWYLLLLAGLAAPARVASAFLARAPTRARVKFLLLSPVLSMKTWSARRPATLAAALGSAARGVTALAVLAAFYRFGRLDLSRSVWLAGYAAIVPLYLLLETFGAAIQIGSLPAGLLPPIHDRPWASSGLADFWGRRWNRLVGDWLSQVCFEPLRRKPRAGVLVAFAASGLLHELLVAVPFRVVTGRSLFGLMSLYFMLQAAAVGIERRWLKRRPVLRRAFAWIAILAPAPLVLNEGSLRIFRFVE